MCHVVYLFVNLSSSTYLLSRAENLVMTVCTSSVRACPLWNWWRCPRWSQVLETWGSMPAVFFLHLNRRASATRQIMYLFRSILLNHKIYQKRSISIKRRFSPIPRKTQMDSNGLLFINGLNKSQDELFKGIYETNLLRIAILAK